MMPACLRPMRPGRKGTAVLGKRPRARIKQRCRFVAEAAPRAQEIVAIRKNTGKTKPDPTSPARRSHRDASLQHMARETSVQNLRLERSGAWKSPWSYPELSGAMSSPPEPLTETRIVPAAGFCHATSAFLDRTKVLAPPTTFG